jgi:hypothetical protein
VYERQVDFTIRFPGLQKFRVHAIPKAAHTPRPFSNWKAGDDRC